MTPKLAGSKWFLLAGLAASSLLVVLVFVRYPGDASTKTAHFGSMLLALLLILAVTIFVGWRGARVQPPEKAADTNVGLIIGLITGCAWVLEISFNNFVDPSVSTAAARYVVDNGFWALISLAILLASFVRAIQRRQFGAAIRVGVWSGLTSGLISCLMGLLLVTVWMPFLLRDPLNIHEYAVRGSAEHLPDMATYFAYETMSGAVGHLTVLGIGMGWVLGGIGGLLARFVDLARSRPWATQKS